MKKIVSLPLIICILISTTCLTSCHTYYRVSAADTYNKLYVGKSYNEIVTKLGAPDRTSPDGNNGTILIYEEFTHKTIATASNINYYNKTYTPSSHTTTSTTYVHVYVDKNNVCYGVKTNRTEGRSKFSIGKTIGLIIGLVAPAIAIGVGVSLLN